jgi:Fic family protein
VLRHLSNLERFINNNKETYYRLLQSVRDQGHWEDWILFMLQAIETTARETTQVIREVLGLIPSTRATLRSQTKFYSPQLLHSLFKYPYTKIEFLAQELGVSAVTARSYLEQMVAIGLLRKVRVGRPHCYVNHAWVAAIEGNSSHSGQHIRNPQAGAL